MRSTEDRDSVLALAERRKCCDIIVSSVNTQNIMMLSDAVRWENIIYDDLHT
jgi:hypothetical protein